MLGLRSVVTAATAIAAMTFAAPLLGQSTRTVRDTTALARLPVYVTAITPANVLDVRPAAPEWTSHQSTTTPVVRMLATSSSGDGSHATPAVMMIVGGAALIVGTVVSGKPGTRIMIGGGILGLIGLWRYTK